MRNGQGDARPVLEAQLSKLPNFGGRSESADNQLSAKNKIHRQASALAEISFVQTAPETRHPSSSFAVEVNGLQRSASVVMADMSPPCTDPRLIPCSRECK